MARAWTWSLFALLIAGARAATSSAASASQCLQSITALTAISTVATNGTGFASIATSDGGQSCRGVTFSAQSSSPAGLSCSPSRAGGLACTNVGAGGGSWTVNLLALDSSGGVATATTPIGVSWAASSLAACEDSLNYLYNAAYTGANEDGVSVDIDVDGSLCRPYSLQLIGTEDTPLIASCPLSDMGKLDSGKQTVNMYCPMDGPKLLYDLYSVTLAVVDPATGDRAYYSVGQTQIQMPSENTVAGCARNLYYADDARYIGDSASMLLAFSVDVGSCTGLTLTVVQANESALSCTPIKMDSGSLDVTCTATNGPAPKDFYQATITVSNASDPSVAPAPGIQGVYDIYARRVATLTPQQCAESFTVVSKDVTLRADGSVWFPLAYDHTKCFFSDNFSGDSGSSVHSVQGSPHTLDDNSCSNLYDRGGSDGFGFGCQAVLGVYQVYLTVVQDSGQANTQTLTFEVVANPWTSCVPSITLSSLRPDGTVPMANSVVDLQLAVPSACARSDLTMQLDYNGNTQACRAVSAMTTSITTQCATGSSPGPQTLTLTVCGDDGADCLNGPTFSFSTTFDVYACAASLSVPALAGSPTLFFSSAATELLGFATTYSPTVCDSSLNVAMILQSSGGGQHRKRDMYTCPGTAASASGSLVLECPVAVNALPSSDSYYAFVQVCNGGSCATTSPQTFTITNVDPASPTSGAAGRRRRRDLELALRGIEASDSPCGAGRSSCPVAGAPDVWECLDTNTQLEACGGCPGVGRDCTEIYGLVAVSCIAGNCVVQACDDGFELAANRTMCLAV